jgi:hypothetical protein
VTDRYSYFDYDGIACRIEATKGDHGKAYAYRPGEGFVDASLMAVLHNARPITKSEFDGLVLTASRRSPNAP